VDEKINELIYEIRSLVNTLGSGGQSSNKTQPAAGSSTSADPSVNRLIVALGMLASRIENTTSSVKKSTERQAVSAKEFTQSVDNLADSMDAAAKATKDAADAKAETDRRAGLSAQQRADEDAAAAKKQRAAGNAALADSITNRRKQTSSSREVFEAAKQAGGGLGQLKNKFLDLAGNSLAAQAGLQAVVAAASGFSKAVAGYSTAIQRGQRGAQVSAQAFEDTVTPISDTASAIGSLALLIGTRGRLGLGNFISRMGISTKAVKTFGGGLIAAGLSADVVKKLYKEGAIQADALFNSFNDISKVGMNTAGGMDDVFSNLQAIGGTTGEIEKFTALLVNNSKQIAFLGASAGDGAKQLSKISGGIGFSKVGFEFRRMGILQDELNEITLASLSIEARSSLTKKRTDEELTRTTIRFTEELDKAARLTGASRKEAADAQAAALANERFRAALIDAEARGDEKELARLKKAQEVSALFELSGDKDAATGIRDMAASGGAPTTDAGIRVMNNMPSLMSELNNVNKDTIDIVSDLSKESFNVTKNIAGSLKLTGDLKQFLSTVGVANTQALMKQIQDKSAAEGKTPAQVVKEMQDAARSGVDKDTGKPASKQTDLMIEASRAMQNAALIQDKTLQKLDISVFLHANTAKVYEDAVGLFAQVVGGMPKDLFQNPRIAQTPGAMTAADSVAGFQVGNVSDKDKGRIAQELKDRGVMELITISQDVGKAIINWFTNKKDLDVPKFATGGIASGPESGHMAMLHGTEAVIPLKGGNIPVQISGGRSAMESGPVFNPQTETNYILEKNAEELAKVNITLSQILEAITGGATMTGGGGAASSQKAAQDALAEHDHAHPHEPSNISPDATKELSKGIGAPLKDMVLTSKFGMRTDPITKKQAGHAGVDFGAKEGTAIYAPEGGTIAVKEEKDAQGKLKGWGKYVEILDEQGKIIHRMAHMSSTTLKTGQKIEAGQEIGKVGNTGRSTGAHLHWEKIDPKTGLQVDPMQWLRETQGRTPGFGTTPGGAATGYPHMTPGGRDAARAAKEAKDKENATPATAPERPSAATVTKASADPATNMMGMLGLGRTSAVVQPSAGTANPLTNMAQSVLGMFGLGSTTPATAPGQADVAGISAGGAPGAISGDITAITQAMAAQTTATQTAITSGMENLTNQLVSKIGGGTGTTADPAVPALLNEMIAAQREQTTAINRLIQVNTS
jgi:murein DD-endopeptidase MepM/ murein hydrolase activator NlpD